MAGRIALIQRGTCNFGVKVLNAQAAGASGVIIFNEGNPGRTGVSRGSLVDAHGNPFIPTIPVAFTSFDIGQASTTEYEQFGPGRAPLVSLSIQAIVDPNADDYNVIAESKGGDPNHVVVVDAHLDAIYGAGMLDNGSGSATILDIAQKMSKVKPLNKLRFIWFGGEELGLLGSKYYVNNLCPTELGQHPLRPRCGRHGDAELHHRRPRPGRPRLLRTHGHDDVPAAGLRAVEGRA